MRKTDDKFLPIGTVVMLKDGIKRVMITGFYITADDTEGKIWDYSGCLYPEGILRTDQTCAFNHDQIKTIYHLGLVDEEAIEFEQKLKDMIAEREKKSQNETN